MADMAEAGSPGPQEPLQIQDEHLVHEAAAIAAEQVLQVPDQLTDHVQVASPAEALPTEPSAAPEGVRGVFGRAADKLSAAMAYVNTVIAMPRGENGRSLEVKGRQGLRLARFGSLALKAAVVTTAAVMAAKGHDTSALDAMSHSLNSAADHQTMLDDTGMDHAADAAPDMHLASYDVPDGDSHDTPPVHHDFSEGAQEIHKGEGWYHQLKEMGITDSHDQAMFLQEHGHELEERGLAYKDGGSWGMNLGHADEHGNGHFSQEDLEFIHGQAQQDGYLPPDAVSPVTDTPPGTETSPDGNPPTDTGADPEGSPDPSASNPVPGPSDHAALSPSPDAQAPGSPGAHPETGSEDDSFSPLAAGLAVTAVTGAATAGGTYALRRRGDRLREEAYYNERAEEFRNDPELMAEAHARALQQEEAFNRLQADRMRHELALENDELSLERAEEILNTEPEVHEENGPDRLEQVIDRTREDVIRERYLDDPEASPAEHRFAERVLAYLEQLRLGPEGNDSTLAHAADDERRAAAYAVLADTGLVQSEHNQEVVTDWSGMSDGGLNAIVAEFREAEADPTAVAADTFEQLRNEADLAQAILNDRRRLDVGQPPRRGERPAAAPSAPEPEPETVSPAPPPREGRGTRTVNRLNERWQERQAAAAYDGEIADQLQSLRGRLGNDSPPDDMRERLDGELARLSLERASDLLRRASADPADASYQRVRDRLEDVIIGRKSNMIDGWEADITSGDDILSATATGTIDGWDPEDLQDFRDLAEARGRPGVVAAIDASIAGRPAPRRPWWRRT